MKDFTGGVCPVFFKCIFLINELEMNKLIYAILFNGFHCCSYVFFILIIMFYLFNMLLIEGNHLPMIFAKFSVNGFRDLKRYGNSESLQKISTFR